MKLRIRSGRWALSVLAVVYLARCGGCGSPPPGAMAVPTGTNAINCNCALAQGACGAGCCDLGTGPGTAVACANTTCATVGCCAPGTGVPGPMFTPCVFAPSQAGTRCCDPGTGAAGQPGCAHTTVDVSGNCSSRSLSVCIPPNTGNFNAFCNTMCATNARSLAGAAGLIPINVITCGALQARGIGVPKASGTGTTWLDATCLGTCSTTTAQMCNINGDCPAGETCSSTCTAVTCALTPGGPAPDNFCFGTITGTCCNVVTPLCGGDTGTAICRPALGDPPGLFTASFSRNSAGELDPTQSSITVTLEDGTTVSPSVRGTVDFTGQPCPGASCSVGITFEAFVTDFTAKGATFSKMTISAGTLSPALNLSPSGTTLTGDLDASNLIVTLQGTASQQAIKICIPGTELCLSQSVGGTQALRSQPTAGSISLSFDVDYVANTFTMTSTAPFNFPRTGNTPGFSASLTFSGRIVNQPPKAVAPASLTAQCDSPTSGNVTLNGTASTDPNAKDLLSYSWLKGREIVGTFVGHDSVITTPAPFSAPGPTTTDYTLQVADPSGQVDTARVVVTVVDTAAPTIEATVNPSCLWSPNHGMVLLQLGPQITAGATDACSAGAPTVYIKSVESDQPAIGPGQGNTAPDYDFGTAAVCLRSEREGTAKAHRPRTYTITLAAKDASGNEGTKQVLVTVPHDQSGNKCPKTPASLQVADGDPRCTENLPGVPVPSATVTVPELDEGPGNGGGGCASTAAPGAAWALTLLLLARRRWRVR